MGKTMLSLMSAEYSEPVVARADEVNSCSAQARHLALSLWQPLQHRLAVTSSVYPEDWGYEIALFFPAKTVYLCISVDEEYEHGFLLHIEPKHALVKRWFRKSLDISADLDALIQVLNDILTQDVAIQSFQWLDEDE